MIPDEIERVCLIGWHVYPVSRTSKAGMFEGATNAASCDLDVVDGWARKYPGCGWRVVAGPSRLFILDVDRPGPTHAADGFQALRDLAREHGPIPPRPMTHTGGSGGAALFFTHAGETLIGRSGQPAPGLDPHRERQAIMIPPSRHPVTGGAYTWRVPPWELAPPPIPAWLATLLRPAPVPQPPQWRATPERAMRAVGQAVGRVQTAAAGSGNDTLNSSAYQLGRWVARGLLSDQDATAELLAAAHSRRIPAREAAATIKSGLQAGMRAA